MSRVPFHLFLAASLKTYPRPDSLHRHSSSSSAVQISFDASPRDYPRFVLPRSLVVSAGTGRQSFLCRAEGGRYLLSEHSENFARYSAMALDLFPFRFDVSWTGGVCVRVRARAGEGGKESKLVF